MLKLESDVYPQLLTLGLTLTLLFCAFELVEAHYRYPLTDNILITPGVFVIFHPDHDKGNDDIWVGILRTTFTF